MSDSTAAVAELPRPAKVNQDLPSILCVDDDPDTLEVLRRQLHKKFQVYTAAGPVEGLQAVTGKGGFGVIVCDFQMPGMNGIEFLTKVRTLAPDSVRIMLTGQTDFSTAMAAVNQGNIFRFLVKPCMPFVLEKILEAGMEQHRLLTAERQLTEETLLGCVQALVDVLSIVQPEAFSRSNRVRRYLKQIAAGMAMPLPWQVDAAAMLSQIGWITLAPEIVSKAAAGEAFTESEQAAFQKHAPAAARLLEKIPRLDRVAKIIEGQHGSLNERPDKSVLDGSDPIAAGALMLQAAMDFDLLRHGGMRDEDVLRHMRRTTGHYLPRILDALAAIEKTEATDDIQFVPLHGLRTGMILEAEIRGKNGVLLLGRGQEVPTSFLQRLGNYSYGLGPEHMCKVRIRRT